MLPPRLAGFGGEGIDPNRLVREPPAVLLPN
jgi:hypothetical protein